MGRQRKPAYDPVKSLLTGEEQTQQFREVVDSHASLLMGLIRFSMRYNNRTKRDVAKGLGFTERHIGRVLDEEITKKTDAYYRLVYQIIKSVKLVEFLEYLYDKDRSKLIQEKILPIIVHSQKIIEEDHLKKLSLNKTSEE
jgi:hypothetical protein